MNERLAKLHRMLFHASSEVSGPTHTKFKLWLWGMETMARSSKPEDVVAAASKWESEFSSTMGNTPVSNVTPLRVESLSDPRD